VTATYCFLFTAGLYNPLEGEQRERIEEIESLGHEIALHFSTHEYWDAQTEPDADILHERIEEEWAILDALAADPTRTVSFHRPPSWILDRSIDRWHNTYAPAFFSDMTYVADSGQRWRQTPPSIREFGDATQVLVHPGLWGERDESFERRIERSVSNACRRIDRKVHREFLPVEERNR